MSWMFGALAALALRSPTVQWEAPLGCPSARAVNEEIARLAPGHAVAPAPAVKVVVTRGRGGFRARVHDPDGARRELADDDCDAVADAVALYVAVTAGAAARPSHAVANRPKVGVAAGFGIGGETGIAPGPTAGMRPSFAISRGAFAAAVNVDYWVPRRVQRGPVSARIDGGATGAKACWVPACGRWALALCGGGEAGLVRAVARGVDRPGRTLRPWLAATLAVRARVRVAPRLAFVAGPELAGLILRPAFTVTDPGGIAARIHAAAPVSVRANLGFEFRVRG
ncbi:MAG: hypothetical protein AAF721_30785 [Myxococcota bacterium]